MNRIHDLTCSGMTTSLAVDSIPRFSWKYILADGYQTGYSLSVTKLKSNKTVWETGSTESCESIHITYGGASLEPLTEYSWEVTIWDKSCNTVSEKSLFTTGFIGSKWQGRWISASFHKKHDDSKDAPYLRNAFTLDKEPISAKLYICSPGYHDAYINGIKAGDDVLTTPYTAFDRTLFYSTYDISNFVKKGENVFGVLIGTGWYNCFAKDIWNTPETSWRHIPKFIAEIHIEYTDGSEITVSTDTSWKCTKSPVIFNGIRNGEYYDANLEIDGWNKPGFDDSGWEPVKTVRAPGGILKAMEMEPERIVESWKPADSWNSSDDVWIFDSGRNMAGFAEITFSGAAGDEIIIKYSERLEADGINIDKKANAGFVRSGEFQTDKYIKKSGEPETWMPRFVYHGYQYVEITGCTEKPNVVFHMVNTDVETTGSFISSDETLNKIHEAARAATLSNLHSVPTDDPHREKNAWTGDVSLSAEQMLYNFNSVPLLRKWLGDIRDAQRPDGAIPCVVPSSGWGYNWGNGPDWSSALTLIPWYIYVMTGDKSILSENYDAVKKHFGYMESMAEDNIVGYGIGDWCPPFEGRAISVSMSSFKTPVEATDTAYFYNTADVISKIAEVLGHNEESDKFKNAANEIKSSFRKRFYDGDTGVAGDCQTSTACMIYQELTEEKETGVLQDYLVDQIIRNKNHQDTGILGNKYLYNVLGEAGQMETALSMILNETYPSFKNWIKMGATTLWECWNGEGSRNHHMFSDISAVFYKYLAGIKPDPANPGFKNIIMKPAVNCGLEYVSGSFETPYGKIISNWKRKEGGVKIKIVIPCGSKAVLELPDDYLKEDYDKNLLAGTHEFFVRQLDRKENLVRYYNENADYRNNMIKGEWKLNLRNEVLEHFKAAGTVKILEVGCGTGQDSSYFMDNGLSVKAIDLSPVHVELCRENGIDACVMDLYNIDFNNEEFDAVYAMNCLLHVPKAELTGVLKEIFRITRYDGTVFIGNYSGDSEGMRKFREQKYGRFFSFTPYDEYANLLEAAGFKVTDGGKLNTDTQFEFNYFILRKI